MKRFSYLIFLLWIPLLFAQQQPKIDLQEVYLAISIDTLSQEIRGEVSHTIFIKEKNDSLFLNASDMNFDAVLLNGKKVAFKEIEDKLILYKKFKKGRTYQIKIKYKVAPKKAVYFLGWEDTRLKSQIWTQGQGKNSSHWVPCLDDMTDKALFNLDITFEESYEVIANGKLFKTNQKDGLKTWQYRMLKPMSSYLLAFAIGRYNNIKIESTAGVPIELYYYPEDSLKVEPTYRYSGRIFDYLTKEVGFSYPWQNYKQVPVHDFLYAGMENTGATIFSDNYVIDSISFIDRNYVNINAHELADQWFGNMVTEVDASHHWL
ncbi:MAG: M1 family aminopeptidase, partial [Eudoraea sp.]|uniref:M1 family aminopeptidase n=1 Tax=Eudoraea sp. TaxID=1979955 RepID=UPI003C74A8D5